MINYQRLDNCMAKPDLEWFWSKFELDPDNTGNSADTIYKGYLKKNNQQTFIVPDKNDKINAKLSLRIIPNDLMNRYPETHGYQIALLNNNQTVSFAALLNTVMLIETKKADRGDDRLLSEKEIAAKLTKLKALNDYDLYLALLPELTPHTLLSELEPFAFDNDISDYQSSFKETDKNNIYHFTKSLHYYRQYLHLI